MARISLDQVCFHYPDTSTNVLDKLSLQVEDGEAHALLGASGAGKSTLLNILSGLLVPTAGRVLFNGRDVSQQRGRARKVAQVFQFPVLYESMSVHHNLAFPLRNLGLPRAEIAARIGDLTHSLGIESILTSTPSRLSLFEKQLVAVAKALIRPDVSVILLDEPLTAVEPRIKWRLRQVLRKAQADSGVTMIYVTHDQTEALTFADRVSVLTEQGILQTDTPQNIYDSPRHEFVGHFVGSPGMNFVPAQILGLGAQQTLGFRPEWATLCNPPAAMSGRVERVRAQGTAKDGPLGIMRVQTACGEVNIRGTITHQVGDEVGVQVQRYLLFEDQVQVGGGDFA